jgi:hypothetical protein
LKLMHNMILKLKLVANLLCRGIAKNEFLNH